MNGPRLSVYAERLIRAGIALQAAALEWDQSDKKPDDLFAVEAINATVKKIITEIRKDTVFKV